MRVATRTSSLARIAACDAATASAQVFRVEPGRRQDGESIATCLSARTRETPATSAGVTKDATEGVQQRRCIRTVVRLAQ